MKNKNSLIFFLAAMATFFTFFADMEARAGGRGGAAGRGGGARAGNAYRGGNVMDRTPSMSRATNRPAVAHRQQPLDSKHSRAQISGEQARQITKQKLAAANRPQVRQQVNNYAQSHANRNVNRQAAARNLQDFNTRHSNQLTQNRQLSNNVSARLQQSRPDAKAWFNRDFFNRHNLDVDYARANNNWWRPAAWATLATWGAWDWATPYYYDDEGYAYPITDYDSAYQDPAYNTTTTTTVYQSSPSQPTGSNQNAVAAVDNEWLPLGVFAVANNANEAMQTNRFIQLAVNKSGRIQGVLYNATTDSAQDLTGMIDRNSQQAYWSLSDRKDSPIASTGVYNLTGDQTPVNVHFTDGTDQNWTLVRLQP